MKAEDIKEARMKLKMTQEQFAHFLGVSFVTLNRWENGVFKPSNLAVEKINLLLNKKEITA